LTRWRYAAATDTGLVRDLNEDAIYVDDILAVVADGMGGHAAGEVASQLTIDIVRDRFHEQPTLEGLHGAIEAANQAIMADARATPEHFGMGTTVIALGLTTDSSGVTSPTLFNVGDSRAYQLRDGALRQLSEDHSVAEEWVRMGRLTTEEAAVHPRRHQLTRTLGIEESLDVDVMSLHATAGDRILLCSDGLSNELSPETLAQLASAPVPLEVAVEQLVGAARHAGGRDNISAILIEFEDVRAATSPVKRTISTAKPPAAQSPRAAALRRSRRPSRFTWRSAAAVVVLLAVVAGFFYITHWYAYSTYYLGNDAGTIAVFQGQPKGVLWFKPVKVLDTNFAVRQLRPADLQALDATISEPTLTAALREAAYLHNEWHLSRQSLNAGTGVSTTTSTTTTTVARG